jgi:hypothetical protein
MTSWISLTILIRILNTVSVPMVFMAFVASTKSKTAVKRTFVSMVRLAEKPQPVQAVTARTVIIKLLDFSVSSMLPKNAMKPWQIRDQVTEASVRMGDCVW